MKIVILLAAALLAGCANSLPATQIIKVPVHVPCVKDLPARPAYEFDKLPLNAPDGEKVLALARDWPRSRIFESELLSTLSGCL